MPSPFRLKVLAMHGLVYEGDALSVTVPTELGPLVIEPGYTHFIGALSPAGVLKIVTPEKNEFYAVFGGVIDVKRNEIVTIYAEEINYGYEIDMARAIAARDRSLDRLNHPREGIDANRAKLSLARALVRINVKELAEGRR